MAKRHVELGAKNNVGIAGGVVRLQVTQQQWLDRVSAIGYNKEPGDAAKPTTWWSSSAVTIVHCIACRSRCSCASPASIGPRTAAASSVLMNVPAKYRCATANATMRGSTESRSVTGCTDHCMQDQIEEWLHTHTVHSPCSASAAGTSIGNTAQKKAPVM